MFRTNMENTLLALLINRELLKLGTAAADANGNYGRPTWIWRWTWTPRRRPA
jgi:hypothetical protein